MMIRDLEELLLSVIDDLSRDYVRESIRCYHAGAFRSSVVLATASCMDDLRRKVLQLKASGAGAGIANLSTRVEKKLAAQETWERDLLDGCKAEDLLTPPEHAKLVLVLNTRHLCAHPSGHNGSAEEAREVIATCIDLVLSRPPQVGGAEIESLVATRMGHANFYGPGGPDAVRTTVKAEVERFRPTALKGLATRLAATIVSEPPTSVLHRHAVAFLGGMVSLTSHAEATRCGWVAVGGLLTSTASASVLPILHANAAYLRSMEEVVRFRALGLVKSHLANRIAQATLAEWHKTGSLADEERRDFLARLQADFFVSSTSRNAHRCGEVVAAAAALISVVTWADLRAAYLEWLLSSLTHGDFYIENAAIDHIRALSPEEAGLFSDEAKARAVMGILGAAAQGADSAEGLCRNGFSTHPEFVDAFVAALLSRQLEFSAHDWKWAETLLTQTRDSSVALKVAEGIAHETIRAPNALFLVMGMRQSKVPAIKALADQIRAA